MYIMSNTTEQYTEEKNRLYKFLATDNVLMQRYICVHCLKDSQIS